LNVSCDFNVYQREFRVVSCDEFTRRFYANEGVALGPDEEYPENLFAKTRAMINMK